MIYFVGEIFTKLNNTIHELSMMEFKEFFDLTAKGINTVPLDINDVTTQFLVADRYGLGKLTREDMRIYVTKLYNLICEVIMDEMSKSKNYSDILKNNPSNIFSSSASKSVIQYTKPLQSFGTPINDDLKRRSTINQNFSSPNQNTSTSSGYKKLTPIFE